MSGILDFIKGVAPMIGGLMVGGPFAPLASAMISKAVGAKEDTPEAIQTAIDVMGPDAAIQAIQQAEKDNGPELSMMKLENEKLQTQETNKTARAEINSDDPYVRRWRPAFGYAVRTCFFIQVGGSSLIVLLAIIAEAMNGLKPGSTVLIIQAIASMIGATVVIWGFALSILGINIHSRSQDKAIQAGHPPSESGMLGTLIKKFIK